MLKKCRDTDENGTGTETIASVPVPLMNGKDPYPMRHPDRR